MSEPSDPEVVILNAALELPAGQRAAYLDKACTGDAALRRQVEALLEAHEQAVGFLDVPPAGLDVKRTLLVTIPLTEKPGDKIGRYKLLQQIGEGGCGVVYMAEQEEPVRRRVALKVIKLGMDTKSVIARFEAERQALALMDHPNIAKVLDAGATETGRPYFVMELVRGIKITDYCDENKVSTEERLKLFIQVCQAIQHAHQKGIIHRDIKPSNILVTVNDGVPVPKVIDFGIAKATQGRLTDKTLFTAFEQFIGTPAYMSPEQAVMTSLDIDTRSDIYSLGVLLYELLTGKTPFDAQELLRAGLDEMRRTIRETEPPKPSTRLSTMLDAERTTTAKHRQTEAPKLIHLVSGDLDWIVMKSLEKDRARRYETANGLTADIQRHLNNEPIVARPPSTLYRFQKAVRRNRLAFATAAAVLVLLLAGITVSTLQAHRLKVAYADIGQRILLESNLRKQAEANEKKAQTETTKSRRVVQFLEDIITGVSPWTAKGRDTSILRAIMDETAERVEVQLNYEPEAALELKDKLGAVYREFGENEKAEAILKGAPEMARKLWGENDPRVADLLNNLGLAVGPARPIEAEALQREALSIRRMVLGTNNMQTAQVERDLAMVLWQEGKLDEAETTASEALAIERKVGGDTEAEVASTLMGLSQIYRDQTNFAKAETADRDALKINEATWSDQVNPAVAASLERVAFDLRVQGQFAEAEPFLRKSVELYRNLYGENESRFIAFRNELLEILQSEGKWPDAESVQREVLAAKRKQLGDKHPDVIAAIGHLAVLVRRQGRLSEAAALYREKLQAARDIANTNEIGNTLAGLLLTLIYDRKFAEAEPLARELAELNGKNHHGQWFDFTSQSFVGLTLLGQKKYAEAEPLLLSACSGMEARVKDYSFDSIRLKEAIGGLVELYDASRQPGRVAVWSVKLDAVSLPAGYTNSISFIPN